MLGTSGWISSLLLLLPDIINGHYESTAEDLPGQQQRMQMAANPKRNIRARPASNTIAAGDVEVLLLLRSVLAMSNFFGFSGGFDVDVKMRIYFSLANNFWFLKIYKFWIKGVGRANFFLLVLWQTSTKYPFSTFAIQKSEKRTRIICNSV